MRRGVQWIQICVRQLFYNQTEYPNIPTTKNRLIAVKGISTVRLDAADADVDGLLTAVAVTSVVDSPVPLVLGATID